MLLSIPVQPKNNEVLLDWDKLAHCGFVNSAREGLNKDGPFLCTLWT